jgi:hypothetical protein
MSAVAEKVGLRRSRLEIVTEAIEQRQAKLAEAEREIDALAAREDDAAAESLRAEPLKSAFALKTPAHELGRRRQALQTTIANLEREIALLAPERVQAEREHLARRLASVVDEGRDLLAKEKEARAAAGKALSKLAEAWDRLAPILTERSELHARIVAERLIETVGAETEVAGRWSTVGRFVVEPVAVDFRAFVGELLEVAFAERRDVAAERAQIDEQNERRAAFGRNQRLGRTANR